MMNTRQIKKLNFQGSGGECWIESQRIKSQCPHLTSYPWFKHACQRLRSIRSKTLKENANFDKLHEISARLKKHNITINNGAFPNNYFCSLEHSKSCIGKAPTPPLKGKLFSLVVHSKERPSHTYFLELGRSKICEGTLFRPLKHLFYISTTLCVQLAYKARSVSKMKPICKSASALALKLDTRSAVALAIRGVA